MRLFAIGDLHLANKPNRDALINLHTYPEDWLILAGDIGETSEHLIFALSIITQKFKQIIWVPGNHDLWSSPLIKNVKRGEYKYNELVCICREYNVLTPEDAYAEITLRNQKYIIVPTLILYDYSFRPENISLDKSVSWAEESGTLCTDEELLFPDPYGSIVEWCEKRCEYTESRLKEIPANIPIILVNHYPLIEEHAQLKYFPRFSLWCGTKKTGEWIKKFNIKIAIYGHMHVRETKFKEGILFEEVSFGYPKDWNEDKGMGYYLRKINPTAHLSKNLKQSYEQNNFLKL